MKPVLCATGMTLKVKERIYEARMKSCMVHDGETYAMSGETERKLQTLTKIMCGVNLEANLKLMPI